MNFQQYLIENNGDQVRGFLRSIGYTFDQPGHATATHCLADYIRKYGVDDLLPLHPDYDLLRAVNAPQDSPKVVLTSPETAGRQSASADSRPVAPQTGFGLSLQGVRGDLVNVALILLCVYLLAKIIK